MASKAVSSIGTGKVQVTFEDNTMTSDDQLELNEYLVLQISGVTSGNFLKSYYKDSNVLANVNQWGKDSVGWHSWTGAEWSAQVYENQ
jgi:hypothetical protein